MNLVYTVNQPFLNGTNKAILKMLTVYIAMWSLATIYVANAGSWVTFPLLHSHKPWYLATYVRIFKKVYTAHLYHRFHCIITQYTVHTSLSLYHYTVHSIHMYVAPCC